MFTPQQFIMNREKGKKWWLASFFLWKMNGIHKWPKSVSLARRCYRNNTNSCHSLNGVKNVRTSIQFIRSTKEVSTFIKDFLLYRIWSFRQAVETTIWRQKIKKRIHKQHGKQEQELILMKNNIWKVITSKCVRLILLLNTFCCGANTF